MLIDLFHGCSSIVCPQFVFDLFPFGEVPPFKLAQEVWAHDPGYFWTPIIRYDWDLPPGIAVAWFKHMDLGRTVWMGDADLPHTI
jgi:hypothetical protein